MLVLPTPIGASVSIGSVRFPVAHVEVREAVFQLVQLPMRPEQADHLVSRVPALARAAGLGMWRHVYAGSRGRCVLDGAGIAGRGLRCRAGEGGCM